MNKKVIAFLSVFTLALSTPLIPANAVWKGTPNLANKRVVPIFNQQFTPYCSSAFLYAPRIVFTAGHVMFNVDDRQQKHVTPIANAWVGFPNSTVGSQTKELNLKRYLWHLGIKVGIFG